jgi:hypothetical protein
MWLVIHILGRVPLRSLLLGPSDLWLLGSLLLGRSDLWLLRRLLLGCLIFQSLKKGLLSVSGG